MIEVAAVTQAFRHGLFSWRAVSPRATDRLSLCLEQELHKRFHYVVILDVTGVPQFDQITASGLLKIAKRNTASKSLKNSNAGFNWLVAKSKA